MQQDMLDFDVNYESTELNSSEINEIDIEIEDDPSCSTTKKVVNETNFYEPNTAEKCYSEDGVGYLCSVCTRLFATYYTYDEHFEQNEDCLNQTLPDPIEIEVKL